MFPKSSKDMRLWLKEINVRLHSSMISIKLFQSTMLWSLRKGTHLQEDAPKPFNTTNIHRYCEHFRDLQSSFTTVPLEDFLFVLLGSTFWNIWFQWNYCTFYLLVVVLWTFVRYPCNCNCNCNYNFNLDLLHLTHAFYHSFKIFHSRITFHFWISLSKIYTLKTDAFYFIFRLHIPSL